jgi:hypothetical protein
MSVSKRRKLVIGGCIAVAAIGGGAVAYAEWSNTASGTGRARATTTVQASVDPVDGTPDLYPGFTQGDVFFRIQNPNGFPITYTDMTPGTITSSDPAACPASNITVAPKAGLSLASPTGTSGTLSITDVVAMAQTAPNGCQGVSFGIALTLSGLQSTP